MGNAWEALDEIVALAARLVRYTLPDDASDELNSRVHDDLVDVALKLRDAERRLRELAATASTERKSPEQTLVPESWVASYYAPALRNQSDYEGEELSAQLALLRFFTGLDAEWHYGSTISFTYQETPRCHC